MHIIQFNISCRFVIPYATFTKHQYVYYEYYPIYLPMLAFCTTIKVLSLRQVSDVFVFTHYYYDISSSRDWVERRKKWAHKCISMYTKRICCIRFFRINFLLLIFFFTYSFFFEWHNRDEKRANNSFLKSMQLWTIILIILHQHMRNISQ